MDKKFKSLVAPILNIEEGKIKDSLTPEDIACWDSFSGIRLINELEQEFDIKFEMEELFAIMCIGDIRKLVKEKIK